MVGKSSSGNEAWLQPHLSEVEQIALGGFALCAAFVRLTLVRHAGDFGDGWMEENDTCSEPRN